MSKNSYNEDEIEGALYLKAKKELDALINDAGKKSKEELYNQLHLCFLTYIKGILKEKNNLTEHETIQRLRNFNIDKTAIDMTDTVLKKLTEIEYNKKKYDEKDLYNLIISSQIAIEEVNIQRMAYHHSIKDKMPISSRKSIIKQFESGLRKLKDSYLKKGDAPKSLLVTLSEYYNYLPNEKKAKVSKEYYYYCKTIPELLDLINELKEAEEEKMQLSIEVAINKLFAKLEDEEKEIVYPRIMASLISSEQKIDFLIMFGYSAISQKKVDKALDIYKNLFSYFESLDAKKKTYYKPIILRYLTLIKKLRKKE